MTSLQDGITHALSLPVKHLEGQVAPLFLTESEGKPHTGNSLDHAHLLNPPSKKSRVRCACAFSVNCKISQGQASYWSATIGEKVYKDIVWSYRHPLPACTPIANLLSFYNERVDAIYVDGQQVPVPKTRWSE